MRRLTIAFLLAPLVAASLAACGGHADSNHHAREARHHAEEVRREAEEIRREAEATAREARRAARDARRQAPEAENVGSEIKGIVAEALDETRRALTGNRDVEPVEASALQALLPADLEGMENEETSANRDGAMGFFITTATGHYTGQEGDIKIALVDIGGIASPARLGYPWTEHEIDRQSEDSYERTVNFNGYRAHEKYDRRRNEGQMAVLVADRFIVAVEGKDVPMTSIKDALSRINLEALEDMRDEGLKTDW